MAPCISHNNQLQGVPKDTKAEETINICLSELDRCYEDNTAPFFQLQGVPKDTKAEETINICLSELDRCYEDNTAPFFLNLAG